MKTTRHIVFELVHPHFRCPSSFDLYLKRWKHHCLHSKTKRHGKTKNIFFQQENQNVQINEKNLQKYFEPSVVLSNRQLRVQHQNIE